jgi:predicted transcriptional regulator YdeE
MTYETIELEKFNIIGISVRTTNQNGQSQKDIGELWGKFMGQGLAAKIPDKESHDIYCMYTDYESDANGPYTTILGCKVSSLENIPEGFTGRTIPTTRYHMYRTKGNIPDCVVQVWQHIWESPIKRKYVADFEVYGEKAVNPENAEVHTYLSVHHP